MKVGDNYYRQASADHQGDELSSHGGDEEMKFEEDKESQFTDVNDNRSQING
jgi:hypothetical protein